MDRLDYFAAAALAGLAARPGQTIDSIPAEAWDLAAKMAAEHDRRAEELKAKIAAALKPRPISPAPAAEPSNPPAVEAAGVGENGDEEIDDEDLHTVAVAVLADMQFVSISLLQRKLRIGYNRTARLIDRLEEEGFIGPTDGAKPREVLPLARAKPALLPDEIDAGNAELLKGERAAVAAQSDLAGAAKVVAKMEADLEFDSRATSSQEEAHGAEAERGTGGARAGQRDALRCGGTDGGDHHATGADVRQRGQDAGREDAAGGPLRTEADGHRILAGSAVQRRAEAGSLELAAEGLNKMEKPAAVASAVPSSEDPAQSPVDRIPAGTGDSGGGGTGLGATLVATPTDSESPAVTSSVAPAVPDTGMQADDGNQAGNPGTAEVRSHRRPVLSGNSKCPLHGTNYLDDCAACGMARVYSLSDLEGSHEEVAKPSAAPADEVPTNPIADKAKDTTAQAASIEVEPLAELDATRKAAQENETAEPVSVEGLSVEVGEAPSQRELATVPSSLRWGHNASGSAWHLWPLRVNASLGDGGDWVQDAACGEVVPGALLYAEKPVADNACEKCVGLSKENQPKDAPAPEPIITWPRWGRIGSSAAAWGWHLFAGPSLAEAECEETTDDEVVFCAVDEERCCDDCKAIQGKREKAAAKPKKPRKPRKVKCGGSNCTETKDKEHHDPVTCPRFKKAEAANG